MRAFVITADGDTVTTTLESNYPSPPVDDVTVAIEWSGVNFKDSMVVNPKGKVRRSNRLVGGVDAAGIISASSVAELRVGDRVVVHGGDLGVGRDGGFAESISVPRDLVTSLPESLSTRDAMVVGTAGYTAFASLLALIEHGLCPEDGEVLVTGATGGVGAWSVAALAAAGYQVCASTGSESSHGWLKDLGATRIIGREEIGDKPERVLGSEIWAGAIDCVGGSTLHQILRTLKYGAGVAASGLVASADLETNVYPFITRNVALLGIDAVRASKETKEKIWSLVASTMRGRDVEPLIDSVIGLEGIAEALATIAKGQTQGRILVNPRN